jgi:hypothetical protein
MAEERNDTAGWIELDIGPLQPKQDNTQIPFRLLANRFKSSSPDSENFIHDPLGELIAAAGTVEAFKEIDRDWTVSTFIVNHEDGLRFVHLYSVAKVVPAKKKVAITMVKLTQAR